MGVDGVDALVRGASASSRRSGRESAKVGETMRSIQLARTSRARSPASGLKPLQMAIRPALTKGRRSWPVEQKRTDGAHQMRSRRCWRA